MRAMGLVSDALIVCGAGSLGWFCWQVWPPAVWLWGGVAAIGYGWRLGVLDASASDQS